MSKNNEQTSGVPLKPPSCPPFANIKKGDKVRRMLAGSIPMALKVSEVTEDKIKCGPWEFCRATGAEIDEELGWDATRTGSFLLPNT